MNLELYIERVERYEAGTMSEVERLAFDAELLTNPELRQALDIYRLGQEVIEQGVQAQLRQQMSGWAGQQATLETPPMVARVNPQAKWIRLAAAASVLLLLGWFSMQWAGGTYSDEAIFAAQYEMPAPATFRSGNADQNPLEPGFRAMEEGNMSAAEDFFKTIPPDQERYAEAQYYLGHAASQMGRYELAISAFKSCIQRNEVKFTEKAEWNLLLTYVAARRTDSPDFRNLLQRIAGTPQHSYHLEASKLMKKLDSVWRKIL